MCGIVGYVGNKNAAPILLKGLERLEYRGYDSAGIAVFEDNNIKIEKTKGKLKALIDKTKNGSSFSGKMGIGHTRWATHGEPSDVNSHPHLSGDNKIAVVHNGIIENYLTLKADLEAKGYEFKSDTDTEAVAHLFNYYYNGDLLDTMIKVIGDIKGSYALGVLVNDKEDTFVAVRKDSPLIVGLGTNENFIASDIPAIIEHTRDMYLLEDNEIVILNKDSVRIYNTDKNEVHKEVYRVNWEVSSAEKGGYKHFMLKEIMEQPKSVRDTVSPRIKDGNFVLGGITITSEDIKKYNKIFIVACGSAYHVGIVGKYIIEELARIPVEVDLASEFRYRNPIVGKDDLIIVISQSGETADTLAALRMAKQNGARIISIVNVVGSSIARESHDVIYTWAGPEIAVATTKAYSAQLNVIYLLAAYFAELKGILDPCYKKQLIDALLKLPEQIQTMLDEQSEIKEMADKFYKEKDVFFLGRGVDYAVALEGSLKLKEISYIHSEAYAAGELKHGTIALIDPGTFVVAIVTQDGFCEKMISNIKEVKARGAVVFAIATKGNSKINEVADYVYYIPETVEQVKPSLSVIPLQLFGYYVSVARNLDVDKPKNLAKSVTVE